MGKVNRILHVLGRLDRGGAETLVMNLYRNIDRSKFQFDFVKHTEEKCDYDEEIIKFGGRIFTISRYNGKNHFNYKSQWNNFFTEHPEYKIIHGHMRSTASIYLGIAKTYGLVTIAHSHSTGSRGNMIQKLIKNGMQFPIRYKANYLLACSNDAGKWLFGKESIKKDNYWLFKNAIDINRFAFDITLRTKMRRKLGIEDKYVVGHVGSFTYPKNHKFLIDVFFEVQKQKTDSILLLIGDGELRESIIRQVKQLNISNKVIFIGNVFNVNEYLQAMDVFVFPSIYEGLGISLIEAQVAGLPCIVSDRVPSEAIVTKEIRVNQLDVILWTKNLLHYYDIKRINVTPSIFRNAGYDIKKSAESLENFYMNIIHIN